MKNIEVIFFSSQWFLSSMLWCLETLSWTDSFKLSGSELGSEDSVVLSTTRATSALLARRPFGVRGPPGENRFSPGSNYAVGFMCTSLFFTSLEQKVEDAVFRLRPCAKAAPSGHSQTKLGTKRLENTKDFMSVNSERRYSWTI